MSWFHSFEETEFDVLAHDEDEGQEKKQNSPEFSRSSAWKYSCHAQAKKWNLERSRIRSKDNEKRGYRAPFLLLSYFLAWYTF